MIINGDCREYIAGIVRASEHPVIVTDRRSADDHASFHSLSPMLISWYLPCYVQ